MNKVERRLNALEKIMNVGTIPAREMRQIIVQINTPGHPYDRPMEELIEERKAELLAKYGTITGVAFDTLSVNFVRPGEA